MIRIIELTDEIREFLNENQLEDGKYEFVFESIRVIIQIDTIMNDFFGREIAWKILEIWKESEDNGRSNKNVNA